MELTNLSSPCNLNDFEYTFADRVINWYEKFGRKDLPWQQQQQAYTTWISEIMLQQTQVATVIPYYYRFIARFPNVSSLADADIDEVLHLWTGLGYYARARNLHKAAILICDKHNAVFPQRFDDVLALPGIGRSTAGAILAFSFGQFHPILDGNVKRVLTRHQAIAGLTSTKKVETKLWQVAKALTPHINVGKYNQAIMDIGATICTRTKPKCEKCPISDDCLARLTNSQTEYPTKRPKKVIPTQEAWVLILYINEQVMLIKRPPAGIWGGLWCLPQFNSYNDLIHSINHLTNSDKVKKLTPFRHTFSHFHLILNPVLLSIEALEANKCYLNIENSTEMLDQVMEHQPSLWYNLQEPSTIGLSAATERILQSIAD